VKPIKVQKRPYTLLLIIALALLLALLAFLQYQWLGRISAGERQIMQTNLRTRANALREEITSEVDKASSRFQINAAELDDVALGKLTSGYREWKNTAAFPGLIKNLFAARKEESELGGLLRLDEATGRFEPVDWPAEFSQFRSRFGSREGFFNSDTRRMLGSLMEHGYVEEEVPAIVRLIVDLQRQDETMTAVREREEEPLPGKRQAGVAIVALDLDYIRLVMIPRLAMRRLAVDGVLDYDIKLVYAKAAEEKTQKAIMESGGTGFSSTPGDAVISLFAFGLSSVELNHGYRWQISITHRAGSLDAAVAEARSRNLIVSFGVLSLLAVSVIIILLSARRSQQLAQKQMEFVAGVSHEFRTPLSVIHAISENLADGLITDRQEVEQCGIVIRDDVRRLAGMVEQVLELAGAFRGKNLYQLKPVDLSGLIERVLAGYHSSQACHIEKDLEPGLPPVMADPIALASAVRNILDNAVKYGGGAGWIRIKAHAERSDHNGTVEVVFEDQGIGISAEDLPHVFEPFYRGSEVRAAQIHGSGLGLSLVKTIVEAHGGTIRVTSAPGQGTCFSLHLPVSSENGAKTQPEGTPLAAGTTNEDPA
jgi:signal transduction histidine kinase